MPDTKTRRVSRRAPCPICQRPDWCRVAEDGGYAVCNRVQSARPARGHGGGWIHRLRDGPRSSGDGPAVAQPDSRPLAPVERRDRIYRTLRQSLSLSPGHRSGLWGRRFTEEAIRQRGYRTLPLEGRAAIARDCQAQADLEGVPGFWVRTGLFGPYWTLAGAPGLLIPCLDCHGRIRAYRIRVEDAKNKYRWLSSTDKPNGTSSGVHCHVARPVTGSVADAGTLWITEGELKADLSAELLGSLVLSIPGVSTWSAALPDVVELLPAGGRVIVALDADWRDKPPVHSAIWLLSQACSALGYSVGVALWEPTHKGLDDLLTVGLHPTVEEFTAIPEPPWPLKMSSSLLTLAPMRRTRTVLTVAAMRDRMRAGIVGYHCPQCA